MRRQRETRVTLDKEREFRAAAHSARLRYVTDADRGFARRRRGKSFRYVTRGAKALRDPAALARIQSLAIPPARQDVWICPTANGRLQATGRDARGRKQYRYHPRWREAQDQNKYERIIAFAKALPKIRRTVARHLRKRGLPREKVLATAVKLLETTLIRVGNEEYARENHSFGMTTMHDTHVKLRGATIRFDFRGKHGIEHEIDLKDQPLNRPLPLNRAAPRRPSVMRREVRLRDQRLYVAHVRETALGILCERCGERDAAQRLATFALRTAHAAELDVLRVRVEVVDIAPHGILDARENPSR